MKVKMQAIHFRADEKLLDFIQKRLDKLDTFFDKVTNGEVFLRVDKKQSKENKVVEIKLGVPGNTLFAKSQKDSFEAATDDAVESLRRQIIKVKEKLIPHI